MHSYNQTHKVWENIHADFSFQTTSRARQWCSAMRAVRLDSKTMEEYLPKIKSYVDELARIDVLVRHKEYVDAILERLPSDYVPMVRLLKVKGLHRQLLKLKLFCIVMSRTHKV